MEEREVRKDRLEGPIALNSKLVVSGRGGVERVEVKENSDSDLLRLRTMLADDGRKVLGEWEVVCNWCVMWG